MADLRVVLVRARNPLNIGAVARAMANFGLGDLALVEPYGEAWRIARSAKAGAGVLAAARVCLTLEEALIGCVHVVGTTDGAKRTPELPLEDWPAVAASLPSGPVALLFGSERTGLGVEEISFCNQLARIPTEPDSPSMNLGQAVAVCAYELARGGQRAEVATTAAPVEVGERERVLEAWFPILQRLGVVLPEHRGTQTRRLRRMLARWQINPIDLRRLLGVARELRRMLAIPASPCIGVCRLGADGLCEGCRRSRQEIAVWGALPERERRRIMSEELPARR